MAEEQMITVLDPQGNPPLIKRKPMAPRLDRLAGKTIYLVDVQFNDGNVLLQQMQSWFAENIPAMKSVCVQKSGVYTFADVELWQEIKARGDAVIMAVGH